MARQYKQPSIVSGLTIQQILEMDEDKIRALSDRDLQKITGRLVSAGNKRMRNLEKQELESPALRALRQSGGKLSTKGKNRNQLLHEFTRARNFLNSKTSLVSEWKKAQKQMIAAMKDAGINTEALDMKLFWSVFNKVQDREGKFTERRLRYKVFAEIEKRIRTGKPADQIVNDILKTINKKYVEAEKENAQDRPKGVSEFFDEL